MKDFCNAFFPRKSSFSLFVFLLNSCVSLFAYDATLSNYGELVCPLLAMPLEIMANQYNFNSKKNQAAVLHMAADAFKICNKALFFYNNATDRHNSPIKRDIFINGAVTTRELVQAYRHLKGFSTEQAAVATVQQVQEDTASIKTEVLQMVQVYVLPALKAFSAFAIAHTQTKAIFVQDEQLRFLATSVHSLAHIIEECIQAPQASVHQKLAAAVVAVNVLWVIKEFKDWYTKPIPTSSNSQTGGENGNKKQNGAANNKKKDTKKKKAKKKQQAKMKAYPIHGCPVCKEDMMCEGIIRRALPCACVYCEGCAHHHFDGKQDAQCYVCGVNINNHNVQNEIHPDYQPEGKYYNEEW